MKHTRKSFLKLSGGLIAGTTLGAFPFLTSCASEEDTPAVTNGDGSLVDQAFGLQLYTLREDMPNDPRGVLQQVSAFGYKQIESYEGPMGMFWGMSNTDFKTFMDELGMDLISSHCNIFENFEQKAAEAAEIGVKYLVCPWIGSQDSLDEYKEMADYFNTCGEICQREGIKFAYHNHGYTFEELEGEIPQDVLMENTDPGLVEYQMDIYWVVTGGADPAEWLRKYPNRFTSSHIKDRSDAPLTETNASTTLGTGIIDYTALLPTARENGMEYFIVEQERYDSTTPLDAVRDNAEYMKDLLAET